jgi:hypothetical protein
MLKPGDEVQIVKSGYAAGTPVDEMIGGVYKIDKSFPIMMDGEDMMMFEIAGWRFTTSEIINIERI